MENCNAKKSAVSREEAQTVLDKIRSVIVREVGCEEKDVVLDACWRDDLGADSLDMAYVMMEVDKLMKTTAGTKIPPCTKPVPALSAR